MSGDEEVPDASSGARLPVVRRRFLIASGAVTATPFAASGPLAVPLVTASPVAAAAAAASAIGYNEGEYGAGGYGGVEDISSPPPVVGDDPPQDLNNDGLYEDVRGDGEFDIFDVQTLFNHLDSDAVQDHPEAFNFNEDEDPEGVTIFDVQGLFDRLVDGPD